MNRQSEIKSMMRDLGFEIVRQRKHIIWSDGKVTIVSPASASCWRTLQNLRRDVKKARRVAG